MRLRGWLVVAATLALTATVVTTGGFPSTDADRDAALSVAADSNAYVSVEDVSDPIDGNRTGVSLLSVGNEAGERIETSVVGTDGVGGGDADPIVENVTAPGTLATGASGNVTADVTCPSGGGSITLDIELTADGTTMTATLTRTVTVECTSGS